MSDVSLQLGRHELLDEIEPLWLSLFRHHREVGPGPFIDEARTWALRRPVYEHCLDNPDAFVLLARRQGRAVGYAAVKILDGADDTWPTGDRFAEVEGLAVLPEERGQGLGTRLLDAVDERLAELGITSLFIAVMVGNDAAQHFYERRGLVPSTLRLMRIGQPPA
jgi:ribosomal protein S18 acetylase RimI-like enzyme